MPVVSLSVPHFKQEWPSSCVAACVRMVLAHYGRLYTEDENGNGAIVVCFAKSP
jgi:hypothetical protein